MEVKETWYGGDTMIVLSDTKLCRVIVYDCHIAIVYSKQRFVHTFWHPKTPFVWLGYIFKRNSSFCMLFILCCIILNNLLRYIILLVSLPWLYLMIVSHIIYLETVHCYIIVILLLYYCYIIVILLLYYCYIIVILLGC